MRSILVVLTLLITPAVATGDSAKRPGSAARKAYVEEFNELQKSSDLGFSFKLGRPDTTLVVVVVSGGRCTRPLLEKIVEIAGDPIRNVGFSLVECSTDKSISVKP